MTNGTSQGLFLVVAIVIFGIFVGLAYTAFGSQGLTKDLKSIFENATEQVSEDVENKKWVNILSNEDTRTINSNNQVSHPIENEVLTENGETIQRLRLKPEATGKNISVWIPMPSDNLDIESLIGEDVQFSVSYRLSEPNHKVDLYYRFYDESHNNEGKSEIKKYANGWENIKVTVENLRDTEMNKDNYYGFVTLTLHTDSIDGAYIDIKDVNLSVLR